MNKLYKYNETSLKFEKVNYYKLIVPNILIIIILFTTNFILLKIGLKYLNDNNNLKKEVLILSDEVNNLNGIIEVINNSDFFDDVNLRLLLEGYNIKFIDIVIAQSILETGNYTSDIFIETGNLFGMKPAKLRPYAHYGEHRGHADYKGNWKLSVIDYALWQAREAKFVKTEEQYYFLLSKTYAEDPEYINKLKNIVNKLNQKK